ncbi:unnamed protein product [Absidia cylindrospora]
MSKPTPFTITHLHFFFFVLIDVANWVMLGLLGLAPGFTLEPIQTSMANFNEARSKDCANWIQVSQAIKIPMSMNMTLTILFLFFGFPMPSTVAPACNSKSDRPSVTLQTVRMMPVSLAPMVTPVPTLSVVNLTPVFAHPVPTVPVGLRGVSCAVQTEPVLLSGGVTSCAEPTEPATPVSSGASCAVQTEPVAPVSLAPSVPSMPSVRDVLEVPDLPVVCPPPPPLATLPVVPVPDVSAIDAVDACGAPAAAADDFINAGQDLGMAAVGEIVALRPRSSVTLGKATAYLKPSRRRSHVNITRPISRSGPQPLQFKKRCIAVMRSRVLSSAEAVDEDEGMGSPCTDSDDSALGCGDALDGVKRLCSWSRCHLVGTIPSHHVQYCTAARTALFKCWSTIMQQHSIYFKVQKRQMVWSPIFGLVDAASACVVGVVDDMDAEEVVASPLVVVGGGVFPAPSGPVAPAQLVPLFPPVPTLPPAVPVLAPVNDPVFCCKTPMAIGPSTISKYDRARDPRVATARKPAPLAKDLRVASATTVPADDVSARKLPACVATCSPLASSSVVAACPQPADVMKNAVGTVNTVLCQSAKSDGDSDETAAASEALEGDEASASGDHAGPPPTAAAVPAPPNDPVSGCKTQLATASVQVPLVATAPKPAPLVLDKQVTVPVSEPAPVTPASVVMKAPDKLSSSIAPLVKASSFFVLAAAPCPMSAADKMNAVDDATAVMDRLDDLGDSATLQDKLDAVGFATAVLDALKGMEDLASGDATDPSPTVVDPVCPSSLPVSVASDDPSASLKGARDVAAAAPAASASSDPVMTSKKASGNVASTSAARASVTTMVEPTRASSSASVVVISGRETILTQVLRRPPIRARPVEFPTRPASKRPAVSSPPASGSRRRVDSKDRGVPESSRKTAKPRRYRSKK